MADDPHDRPDPGDRAGAGHPATSGPGDEPAGGDVAGGPSPGGRGGLDATRAFPAAPGDEGGPPAGRTERFPAAAGGGGGAAAGGPAGGDAGRWSGRAGVPRPVPAEQVTEVWSDEPPRRGSLMPLLIGLVILALLALIGYGVWLALRPKDATPAPAPSPSAAATSRSATPTASPPAPTTTRPRPTRPVMVAVPPVTGLPLDAARAALRQLGLRSTVQEVEDPAAPGTVIRTDPVAGTEVQQGSVVTLAVAKAPPPTSAPSPSASAGG